MRAARSRFLGVALLLGSLLGSGTASASGLQVTPTGLTLQARQVAAALWLSNSGDSLVRAQVRVYQWTEAAGQDHLEPSRELVISPPMLQVEPGRQQMIRVIRVGAPPSGAGAVEAAYRLSVDELPITEPGQAGLRFVVHYSLPVFIEPVGAIATKPDLHWQLLDSGGKVALAASNSGNGHAQLSGLTFIASNGRKTTLAPGLLGYVLPGARMEWTLAPPAALFARGGTLEAMVNGHKTSVALASPTR